MAAIDVQTVPAGQLQPGDVLRLGDALAVVIAVTPENRHGELVRVTLAVHRLANESVEVILPTDGR